MVSLLSPVYGEIEIPVWVNDHRSFRRWVRSGDLPDKLPVHFLRGKVWVDLYMEEVFSHNQVKQAVNLTLGGLVEAGELGVYYPDGLLLTNPDAGFSCGPDAVFVSAASLAAGRVRFTAGRAAGSVATEMVGTPDAVVEVVSASSVDKDTEWLMSAYHDAGIPEYWLIDARGAAVRFDVYRRERKEFVPAKAVKGWVKSPTFGRSFRLVRRERYGLTGYKLDVK